jgi:hypothetical protein
VQEVVEGGLCLLEVMRCVLLCSLEVLEVREVMRCVQLCMLEASEVIEVSAVEGTHRYLNADC